ncbi:MAG: 30S ribosomal protein S20 [Candidatus Nanopelagicales bacterium]
MANIKSQISATTNEKARLRSKVVKSSLKTSVRKFPRRCRGRRRRQGPGSPRGRQGTRQGGQQGRHPRNQAANRKSAIDKKVAAL